MKELTEIYPEDYYSKRQENKWTSNVYPIAKALIQEYDPKSVVDIGCGICCFKMCNIGYASFFASNK